MGALKYFSDSLVQSNVSESETMHKIKNSEKPKLPC